MQSKVSKYFAAPSSQKQMQRMKNVMGIKSWVCIFGLCPLLSVVKLANE